MITKVDTTPGYPDSLSHLEALESAYRQGRYSDLPGLLQAWESGWHLAPLAQRQRVRMLGLHSLSKLGDWQQLVQACSEALCEARIEPGPPQVQLLILWSFGELQLGAVLRALELAQAGLSLALDLQDPSLCAQTHERLAMAELSLGSAATAESHMLEAIGYALQLGDYDISLLRYSNGLFLFNALKQALRDQGRSAEAHALRLRMQRYVTQGRKVEGRASKAYERCMWQANMTIWQLRSKRCREAENDLKRLQALAADRGWLQIRRAIALELAELAMGEQQWARALQLLEGLHLPDEPAPRRRHALQREMGLARVQDALGRTEAAAQARARAQALAEDPIQHQTLEPVLRQALTALLSPEQQVLLAQRLAQARRSLADPGRLRIRGVA